jgi:ubiquinone/menaquinone biosynthesis C-methylase UbiE
MNLRPGIPLAAEVDQLTRDPLYSDHTASNRAFLARHGQALQGYGKLWGQDPFQMWSRRWEYPFEAQKVLDFVATQGDRPLKMLDGGSGVTYVPYLLVERCPHLSVICCDTNTSYAPMFAAINKELGHERVTFQEAALQKLPYADGGLDIVACMSVLEHTDNYAQIINEFARVLRPGGLLVLTFDLSLDGKFTLSRETAAELLRGVQAKFDVQEGLTPIAELAKMDDKEYILTTDRIKQTQPELLPWRFPLLKGLHDLSKGYGWTGGFRSKSVFCLSAIRKA